MKIHCAAILALGITADAFSTQSQQRTTSTQLFTSTFEDDGFVDALKGKSNEESDGADSEEPASGSSRFKDLMQAAKTGGGSGRQIQNPFLNPQAAPAPVAPAGVNLENMSVEDQAALLRQLMAGGGGSGGDPNTPPPAMKEKRTDQAGKPTGRNRDADTIANSADLYFAQLKRDSTVRTLARIRGEDDVADAVMEDEGIRELDNLLVENPYLKGQKQEESTFFEAIPEESLGPFLHAAHSEEKAPASTSGIKYKDILEKKRSKQQPVAAAAPVAEPPAPEVAAPQPVVQQAAATPPAPVAEAPQEAEEPVEIPRPAQPTVTSYTDEARQKLRTFMGLLLKHRGGPGFGSGRLKGPEIDRFETMLGEIMTMLREESMQAAPADVPMMTAPVAAAPQPVAPVAAAPQPVAPAVAAPAAPVSANADLAQVDGAVACIEGATMMYKNSPAQLRESLLGALRAALIGAVNTCSRATGVPEVTAEEIGGSATPGSIAQIDGVIACIDGAVTMYKNSPDTVKPDMLVALRAALVSAIGMCNSVIEGGAVAAAAPPASVSPVTPAIETPPPQPQAVVSSAPSVPSPPEAEPAAPVAPEEPEVVDEPMEAHMGPDANSEVLTKIYNQVKAASGNGSLGLRGDLTSSEASELADSLVEVRKVLMKELNEGIPEVAEEKEQEAPQPVVAEAEPAAKSSVASRYKEMLAKARAEKEGKAVPN